MTGSKLLSFKERQKAQKLELQHGVIINTTEDHELIATRWNSDNVLAEASDIHEMEIVLKSLHIYPESTG